MKLIDWMRFEGLDDGQVAERLSALIPEPEKTISASAVRKWKYGERIPRQGEMQHLHTISDGKVSPNDFYGIDTPSEVS